MKSILIIVLFFSMKLSAHPGIGIVEDSKGNIYYTDLKQVWKIDVNGSKSIVVQNVHTHELAIDEFDTIYGEHLWYNGEEKDTWGFYVWSLSAIGTIKKVIPATEGFRTNYSFVKDKFGNMFQSDRTTKCQFVTRGKNTFSRFGHQCFHNIRAMAMTKNDELLVVDFQDIIKLDRQGSPKIIASQIADKSISTSSVSNQNSVMGVWDDPDGNIYAAVFSNRLIKKFDSKGKEETVYQSRYFWSPSGGLISRHRELWVLETSTLNDVRVVRVMLNGKLKSY